MNKRFPWRIFIRIFGIQSVLVVLAMGASGITLRYFFKQQFIAQMERQTHDFLKVVSLQNPDPAAFCKNLVSLKSFEMSLVDPRSGRVWCGQVGVPIPQLHAQALQQGFASQWIEDPQQSSELLVSALLLGESGLLLKKEMSLDQLNKDLGFLDRSLGLFLVAIVFVLGVFSFWSGRKLIFPMGRLLIKAENALKEPAPQHEQEMVTDLLEDESYGEWSELESSLDEMRRDLKSKAESLSNEREELATLMSAISEAILAVDLEGRPLFFNSKFAWVFASESALRDQSVLIWDLFREPQIVRAFRSALELAQPSSVSVVAFGQENETKKFFSISVSPLRKKGGQVYGAVGIFHDVTELKSAEQIRIDFVANVSHELRTPLTSIKGYTDTLILDAQAGREIDQSFLTVISRNVQRLMSLIQDLLDLSAVESTDILHKVPVSLGEFTDRVIAQLKNPIEEKKQKLLIQVNAKSVLADPRRLEQVMVNLLENAQKYTPPGGCIEVVWEADLASASILLKVKDNGPGVPIEHQSRLFERFYRVDPARSREQGGTGLGLSIVKHILLKHEGAVWVESDPASGPGSTFICRFPMEG